MVGEKREILPWDENKPFRSSSYCARSWSLNTAPPDSKPRCWLCFSEETSLHNKPQRAERWRNQNQSKKAGGEKKKTSCCSLQKNCNSGDDLFSSKTITLNRESELHSHGLKTTIVGQVGVQDSWLDLKCQFAHSSNDIWQRLRCSAEEKWRKVTSRRAKLPQTLPEVSDTDVTSAGRPTFLCGEKWCKTIKHLEYVMSESSWCRGHMSQQPDKADSALLWARFCQHVSKQEDHNKALVVKCRKAKRVSLP